MWSPKQPIKECFPHIIDVIKKKKSSEEHHQKLIRTNKKMYKATVIECDLNCQWMGKPALKKNLAKKASQLVQDELFSNKQYGG